MLIRIEIEANAKDEFENFIGTSLHNILEETIINLERLYKMPLAITVEHGLGPKQNVCEFTLQLSPDAEIIKKDLRDLI